MINKIAIENFRSIRSANISLAPLTIIIGANGSGKSNLVKAVEFIATIPSCGLSLAISRQGGRDGLMPKQIPSHEIKGNPTSLRYTKLLKPPPGPKDTPEHVEVHHEFSFKFTSPSRITVTSETLEFSHVLYIGQVLGQKDHKMDVPLESPFHHSKPSTFKLQYSGGSHSYSANPPISDDTLAAYLSWLGLSRFASSLKTPRNLEIFLSSSQKETKNQKSTAAVSGPRTNRRLYIDRYARTICDFALHFHNFLDYTEDTKRYDLLLNELRREQPPSDSSNLSKAGENLPSALRKLATNKIGYARLLGTLETIAPHIVRMKSTSLRTGKEFVEFAETASGRGIESWETSDGTLRALAILVAVESANSGETIIVEEPEQNLHPWAVRALVDHIREVVTANSIQVILTTHSEHVLERALPDEVLVASRTPEEGTKYRRVEEIVSKGPIEMGEIGRLWVKGVLGGVPSVEA